MTRRPHATVRALIAGAICLAAIIAPPPVAAADVTWGTPTATSTWAKGIDFRQPAGLQGDVVRVELLIDAQRSAGPLVRVVPTGATGNTTLSYFLETTSGGLLPNTQMTARWRVVARDGTASLGPSLSVRYADTRFTWQTRADSLVRVHWYEGGAAFGDRALQIGTRAVATAGRLLGVTETEPVDFFVYASQAAFYDALGPGTRENVGGQADAATRTLFALITPGEINASWVEVVIAHELTHLVFDTAVANPYHFPPRWLNEGLAVYLAQGYEASDRSAVERAVAAGALMPLTSLAGQFPTTAGRFALAYAQSVAAVDHLVRQHGEAALVRLIRSYAGGVTDDEAFRSALGTDLAGFDAAWRSGLNAKEPVAYGPQPAPGGPLPPDWTAGGGAVATSSPGGSRPDAMMAVVLLIAGAVALVVGLGALVVRNRRRGGPDA